MEYIICRVCGYIETADKKDLPCPACGFPKTVWMDYKPRNITENRRKLLDAHIHPILVHFPVVFNIMAMGLPLLGYVANEHYRELFFEITQLICYVLPLLALAGAVSGIIAGKMRYHTYSAHLLKRKIICSILYFILTCVLFGIAISRGVTADTALWVIILAAVSSVPAILLGRMGSHLFATILGPYVASRPKKK